MILGWNYAGGKGFDLKRAEELINCSGKEKILANLPNPNDIEILDFYFKHGRYSDLFSNVEELKIPPDSFGFRQNLQSHAKFGFFQGI
ncbi:MAG: hypothetical protein ACLUKN_15365 [Bacilli bacterium]